MKLSVIIPVRNERAQIKKSLTALQWLRCSGHEIIVVDGGSEDGSCSAAEPFADKVISTVPGRAIQMNCGARHACGDIYLFLHVDTLLMQESLHAFLRLISENQPAWGRFDVRLSGIHPMFRIIERMMNWRSRLTGIATGDQAIFVRRDIFHQINGFSDIPLMEDIEICRRLKAVQRPLCLTAKVETSSRRWEEHGILATMVLMWKLRFSYWIGADPNALAKQYYVQ